MLYKKIESLRWSALVCVQNPQRSTRFLFTLILGLRSLRRSARINHLREVKTAL